MSLRVPLVHRFSAEHRRLISIAVNWVLVFAKGGGARPIGTLADSATPSVAGYRYFLTGGTTTITDFTDGEEGQVIMILAEHTLTITDGTNIILADSKNLTLASGDTLTLIQKADGKWYEVSRSAAPGFISAGSSWNEIMTAVVPTAANTFDITFDETAYSKIWLHWEDLQTNDDGASLRIMLGSGDGGTIYNTTGDYSVMTHDYNSVPAKSGTTTDIRIAQSWGNAAGEGSYGDLILSAFQSANNGALVHIDHVYKLNTGSLTQYHGEAAFEGASAAIDTVRFGLVAGAHNFVAAGQVRVFGIAS